MKECPRYWLHICNFAPAILKPKIAKEPPSQRTKDRYVMTTKLMAKIKGSTQHCIKAIAGEVVNQRLVHLINFGSGGQVIALKSATALILDR